MTIEAKIIFRQIPSPLRLPSLASCRCRLPAAARLVVTAIPPLVAARHTAAARPPPPPAPRPPASRRAGRHHGRAEIGIETSDAIIANPVLCRVNRSPPSRSSCGLRSPPRGQGSTRTDAASVRGDPSSAGYMSVNQSRYQKSEPAQDRRGGARSASISQQRASSGGYSKGGGAPAPSPPLSFNRSYKKTNNVQGGQSRVSVRPANISSEPLRVPLPPSIICKTVSMCSPSPNRRGDLMVDIQAPLPGLLKHLQPPIEASELFRKLQLLNHPP
ncbi:hypothetical protein NL676_009365 [Syzygium grande]|nr:hypothetical protein NL676_009365 [Syzygium grande]